MAESTTTTTVADPCEYCGVTAAEAGVPVALVALRRAPADEGAGTCEYALCERCARDYATGRTACASPAEHGDLCDCADGVDMTAAERAAVGAECARLVAEARGTVAPAQGAQCTWVARCTNASVGTVTNATVGVIHVCDACLAYARAEALWAAEAASFVPFGAEHGPAVPWRLATVRQRAERRQAAEARLAHKAPEPADPRKAWAREYAVAMRTARTLSGRDLAAEAADERALPVARQAARDEIARRAARRNGGTFRRIAEAAGARLVASPTRIVHVSRYRVSGRPADLRGHALA